MLMSFVRGDAMMRDTLPCPFRTIMDVVDGSTTIVESPR